MAKKANKTTPTATATSKGAKLLQVIAKGKPAITEIPATPKDTNLGPNAKFPFGIKVVDAKGNISWERFATAKDRDTRMASVKGGKRVDLQLDTPAAAAKPEVAKPAAIAPPAAKPEATKPAAKPAKPADKADILAIHVNKTGRVCFSAAAAARLGDWQNKHMAMAIDKGLIRIDLAKPAADTLPVRDGSGRPYISATKQLKPLGFDGNRPYDIEAKPYGNAGFEFRLA